MMMRSRMYMYAPSRRAKGFLVATDIVDGALLKISQSK